MMAQWQLHWGIKRPADEALGHPATAFAVPTASPEVLAST